MFDEIGKAWLVFWTFLAMVVIFVAISWQMHWLFFAQSTKLQAEVNRSSYGFQQAQRDALTQDINQVLAINTQVAQNKADQATEQALAAQRHAVLAKACGDAAQIQGGLGPDQTAFLARNCTAGAPAADPSYT